MVGRGGGVDGGEGGEGQKSEVWAHYSAPGC